MKCTKYSANRATEELRVEGFEPHECAPMLVKCELLVDLECTTKEPIQTGSGTLGYGIVWHIADLAKLKEYTLIDIQEEKK